MGCGAAVEQRLDPVEPLYFAMGELLGHNSLDSTLRYLAVTDERKRWAIGALS
jgi:hypothetical protein